MAYQPQSSLIDLNKNIDLDENQTAIPSKRLYSAVLQGISGNIKPSRPSEKLVPVLNVFGQTSQTISSPIDSNVSCDMTFTSQDSLCIQELSSAYGFQSNANTKEQFHQLEHETLPPVSKHVNNRVKNLDTNTSFASFINSSTLTGSFPNNLQPPVTYNAFSTSFPNSINVVSPQYLNTHNYHLNSPFRSSYQNSIFYSSTFTTNFSQIIVNRSLQSLPNTNCLSSPSMMMMQQNRTAALYPISHQYMQQSFYPPSISCPRAIQRWLQPDYARSPPISSTAYASTISPNFMSQPPVHWTGQNNYALDTSSQIEAHICKIRNKLRRSVPSVLNIPHTKMKHKTVGSGNMNFSINDYIKSSTHVVNSLGKMSPVDEQQRIVSFNDKSREQEEMSEILNETTGDLLMNTSRNLYVSMIPSFSEELEIQAIEQYCTSGPDVYQELEKQAEEQYEHHSENWISPPKIKLYFGGQNLFNEVMYRL